MIQVKSSLMTGFSSKIVFDPNFVYMLFQFNSKMISMAEGETMLTDGDPEQGMYVVMSGLVQVIILHSCEIVYAVTVILGAIF
jgi:CRP-like cAMP-binding protein